MVLLWGVCFRTAGKRSFVREEGNHMKRRILSMLLALMLVASIPGFRPVPASAEALYIRKIVSVVYDDSGSMEAANKWAYANYAMQSFCGMLNSDDQLFITYMSAAEQNSRYDPEKVDLSAGGIQNSVDSIRNHTETGNTPYAAVKTAYEKLKSVDDSNPNTQYWLVVISDGDFNDYGSRAKEEKTRILNDNFKDYVESTMPNGTKPQVTFLGIGGDIARPDEDPSKGIYTYSATDAAGIIGAMSEMADRISGRTRLQKNDVRQEDSRTIRVSSTIPLLNIVVFGQGSAAKVTGAVCNNEYNIPISRNASLSYPGYPDLVGGAFLLGDSKTVIGAGEYVITFDQDVDLDDVIILFEPALELRMTIAMNGTEITDLDELDNAMEGDKISVSCKIYEIGTDTEIDPALMPPGTKFEVTVSEGGTVVDQKSGKELTLTDYVLKQIETEITAAAVIEGFNPIDYTIKLEPTQYVPRVTYTMSAAFGSDIKHVKRDQIAGNQDLSVCFTVYADGVAITDPAAVQALNPVITVSPQGNSGDVAYSADGKIVFTPKAAGAAPANAGSFDVDVTCTIGEDLTATETYTVLLATYEVMAEDTTQTIRRNELFNNPVAASFYITKDGVKLDKAAVEQQISASLDDAHADLKTNVSVAPDGTISIAPYSDVEHKRNWFTEWAYYFGLESSDITVSLNHAYGSADSTLDVIGAGAKYLILWVYLPLVLELLLLAAVIAYIVRYFTKPRFAPNAVLYVGRANRIRKEGGHRIKLKEIRLGQFNKFKYLWNPFKELIVSANGVSITAAKGGKVLCNEKFPWYSGGLRPKDKTIRISTPRDVMAHCGRSELAVEEILPTSVMSKQDKKLSQNTYYLIKAKVTHVAVGSGKMEVIDSAVVICYSTRQQ